MGERKAKISTSRMVKKLQEIVWHDTHHILAVLVGNVLLQTLLTAE